MASGNDLALICDQIRAANVRRESNTALASAQISIRGGNSKAFYGETFTGLAGAQGTTIATEALITLETSGYKGISAYEPTELVITAKCGTLLSEIEAELSSKNQMLAFEPPRFSAHSTIGGVIASGLSGPRRVSVGAARDFVLGVSLIDASGQELHFGGQVMKNVAGYDVSRLLCGSMGALGVISQVSLKVLPIATGDATIGAHCSEAEALDWLNRWAGLSLPIAASVWKTTPNGGAGGELRLRLSGAPAAVSAAIKKLSSETAFTPIADAAALADWAALRDQNDAFFQNPAVIRFSLPSTAPSITAGLHSLGGAKQLIEWGGALRWITCAHPEQAVSQLPSLQKLAKTLGGSAMLYKQSQGASIFAELDAMTLKIHQRLKAQFDPTGLFNATRLNRAL